MKSKVTNAELMGLSLTAAITVPQLQAADFATAVVLPLLEALDSGLTPCGIRLEHAVRVCVPQPELKDQESPTGANNTSFPADQNVSIAYEEGNARTRSCKVLVNPNCTDSDTFDGQFLLRVIKA